MITTKPPAILFACLSLITAAGCASLTPQQAAERNFQRELHQAVYLAYRDRCFALGGKIIVDAHQAPGRNRIPHRGDRYFCG